MYCTSRPKGHAHLCRMTPFLFVVDIAVILAAIYAFSGPYYMPIYAGGPLIGCGAMGSFSGFIVYMVKGSGDPNYGRMVMMATHIASAIVCTFGILFVAFFPLMPCHEMTCWGLLHCDPCTTGGAVANGGCGTEDAGVSNRSIYCRLDQQYLTQKCGKVYCSKFDEDCWKPMQDNGMYWGFRDEKHCTEYSVNKWEEIPRDILIGICAGVVQVIFSVVTILLAYYTEWHDPNNEEAYIKPKHKEKILKRKMLKEAKVRAKSANKANAMGLEMTEVTVEETTTMTRV